VAEAKQITQEALLAGLRARGPLFAPDEDGRWIEHTQSGLPAIGSIRPKRPIRDLFVPPVREIARFNKHVSAPEIHPVAPDTTPGSVYGVRPCDARALAWLDQVFLAPPHIDVHYQARRDKLLLIGLACEPSETCHCGLFGFGPDEASELDVMLYPNGQGFVALAGSERGQAFVDGLAGATQATAPARREGPVPEWWSGFPEPEALLANFEHPVWEALQIGCMNCGACTLYCPTCQCFTIVDEPYKSEVLRRRVIDTCQHSDFTRMAGGHNPRTKRHSRLRQRVMHKFAYIPARSEGQLGCSGCGRCVELCGLRRHLFADLAEIKDRIAEGTGDQKVCG
jgi:ferredoxin